MSVLAVMVAMLPMAAATWPSDAEMKEWNETMAAAMRRDAGGRAGGGAGVAAYAGLRGSCVEQLTVSANDISCGSAPFCKVFIVDPSNYTGAQWCTEKGKNDNVYDRRCPALPVVEVGLTREVVVWRRGHPRSLRVRLDEVDRANQSMSVHLEVFEGLPQEEAARSKHSTLFRDECAQMSAPYGYGIFKVCNDCSYR